MKGTETGKAKEENRSVQAAAEEGVGWPSALANKVLQGPASWQTKQTRASLHANVALQTSQKNT
eukprot:1159590-Pelagomonas_calceolata.AAC.7